MGRFDWFVEVKTLVLVAPATDALEQGAPDAFPAMLGLHPQVVDEVPREEVSVPQDGQTDDAVLVRGARTARHQAVLGAQALREIGRTFDVVASRPAVHPKDRGEVG